MHCFLHREFKQRFVHSHNTKLTEGWLRRAVENRGSFKLSNMISAALLEALSPSSAHRSLDWTAAVSVQGFSAVVICSSEVPSAINLLTQMKRKTHVHVSHSWTQPSRAALTASIQCSCWMNWSFTSYTFVATHIHILKYRISGPWTMRACFSIWCEMTARSPFRAVIHGHQFQALWSYMGSTSYNTLGQRQN